MGEGSIKGWMRDNPVLSKKVQIFGKGRTLFNTLIVTNNSPLGRVFSGASTRLFQYGVMDRISANWLERKTSFEVADLESAFTILKPGQMILIYCLMFVGIIITSVFFLVEHLWRNCLEIGIRNNIKRKLNDAKVRINNVMTRIFLRDSNSLMDN